MSVLGSQFMTKLMSTGYAGVRLWNKGVCIYFNVAYCNFFFKLNFNVAYCNIKKKLSNYTVHVFEHFTCIRLTVKTKTLSCVLITYKIFTGLYWSVYKYIYNIYVRHSLICSNLAYINIFTYAGCGFQSPHCRVLRFIP